MINPQFYIAMDNGSGYFEEVSEHKTINKALAAFKLEGQEKILDSWRKEYPVYFCSSCKGYTTSHSGSCHHCTADISKAELKSAK